VAAARLQLAIASFHTIICMNRSNYASVDLEDTVIIHFAYSVHCSVIYHLNQKADLLVTVANVDRFSSLNASAS